MSDFESVDFFTDASLIPDPYPYFDHLRERWPVLPSPHQGVVAITGHQEALAVYKDPAFSSCVSVAGPFSGLPFEPEGDDIGALIEQHRSQIPMSEHIVTPPPTAGDNVFALCVREELAPKDVLTGTRVSREADARAGSLTLVTEHHLNDIDGGSGE